MTKSFLSWLMRGGAAPEPEHPASESVCIAASRHRNGYTREAAVRELCRFESAAALQAIIERLNDWVPQVRDAAALSLKAFMRTKHVPALLANLNHIVSLEKKTRADHREHLSELTALLSDANVRHLVENAFVTTDQAAARFLFTMLNKSAVGSDDPFFSLAIRHRDVTIRVLAVSALRSFSDAHADELFTQSMNDSHGKIRCEAFRELWKRHKPSPEKARLLQSALLDSSESVKALARLLATKEGVDVDKLIGEWIADESVRTAHPAGLINLIASRRFKAGFDFVRSAIAHPRAPVRAAALAAWVAMDRDSADEVTSAMLADSSNKVASLARRFVARGDVALTRAQFDAAIERTLEQAKLRRAITVAKLLPTWSCLDALLHCLESACDAHDITNVKVALEAWSRRSSNYCTKADAEQMASIRARLDLLSVDDKAPSVVRRLRKMLDDDGPGSRFA